VPANILKVEDAFKDELAKLRKDGFTDQEIAEAKKTYAEKRAIARSQDAGLVRMMARDAQFDWTMAHDADLDAKIAALTTDQLNAAVRKYLDPAQISYFKAGDFKKAGISN
jgi:zinc protease